MMSAQDSNQQENQQKNLDSHILVKKNGSQSPSQKIYLSPNNKAIRDERRRANHNEGIIIEQIYQKFLRSQIDTQNCLFF
jgi:hypothetical protein